jgi:serine/threonine protein kinase
MCDGLRSGRCHPKRRQLTRHPYNAPIEMALQSGSTLGPYEIVSLIGAGGMGEVYRARAPRLNRDVAIKVRPIMSATLPHERPSTFMVVGPPR